MDHMWRGLLIFLTVCAAVLVTSPTFWWLIQSEYGAAPSTTIEQDGRHTPTLIGPASPWPEWAQVPPITSVTPRYWEPMQGNGSIEFETSAYAARHELAQSLRDRGWSVRFWRQPIVDPGLHVPVDHPMMACVMRGVLPGSVEQALLVQFMPKSDAKRARAYWWFSIVKQIEHGSPEAC
jgi:hypothetical protein